VESKQFFCSCLVPLVLSIAASFVNAEPKLVMREVQRFNCAEAHQAVAVDETTMFAISNRGIGKYSKLSGKLLKQWTAPSESPIRHMNSGVVIGQRLYCANSNWPQTPLRNSVEIFDTESLDHVRRQAFSESQGAINWIDRRQGAWWIVFAYYGKDVRRTRLVRYDDQWREMGQWSFPESVVERFLPNSNSGGAFGPSGRLYVSGHDHGELYVMDVPDSTEEKVLRHVTTVESPIAGQGIAWDRSDIGSLFGIVRKNHEVVKMRLSHSEEFTKLLQPVEWIRDPKNPILPPRKNEFDSTRCMNPWVLRNENQYHVFYSGGDAHGRQRIGVATAKIDSIYDWNREGPLFETGAEGAFDARWCVLPHVVRANEEWRLYYTGNSGRGMGLSAFPGIGVARSLDMKTWRRSDKPPVLAPTGEHGSADAIGIAGGSILLTVEPNGASQWRFYYTGCPTTGTAHALNQQKTICLAVSADGLSWTNRGAVMMRDPNRDYENIGVAGPVVIQQRNLFRMWYSAIGSRWGFYSICYAESDDGIHWRRGEKSDDNLQLTPTGEGWEKQMVEYPTIISEGDRLRMFYCGNGYGRSGIGTATSKE
jgi:predicted GH43/DUF377 family glycosyl hydrolase